MIVHGQIQRIFEFLVKIRCDNSTLHRFFISVIDGKQHKAENCDHYRQDQKKRDQKAVDLMLEAGLL